MRRAPIPSLAAAGVLALASAALAAPAISSVYTSLNRADCAEAVDKSDPNEIPYWICPGAGGYRLELHKVESGRMSLTVAGPADRRSPLDIPGVVTRAMSSLDERAEWRVRAEGGEPVALVVRVRARENADDPAEITRVYWAVAKIGETETCVTDRIERGSKLEAQLYNLADTAARRPCAPRLPESD